MFQNDMELLTFCGEVIEEQSNHVVRPGQKELVDLKEIIPCSILIHLRWKSLREFRDVLKTCTGSAFILKLQSVSFHVLSEDLDLFIFVLRQLFEDENHPRSSVAEVDRT